MAKVQNRKSGLVFEASPRLNDSVIYSFIIHMKKKKYCKRTKKSKCCCWLIFDSKEKQSSSLDYSSEMIQSDEPAAGFAWE